MSLFINYFKSLFTYLGQLNLEAFILGKALIAVTKGEYKLSPECRVKLLKIYGAGNGI